MRPLARPWNTQDVELCLRLARAIILEALLTQHVYARNLLIRPRLYFYIVLYQRIYEARAYPMFLSELLSIIIAVYLDYLLVFLFRPEVSSRLPRS